MTERLPEGYQTVAAGRITGFACHAATPWLERVLGSGRTLDQWAQDVAGRAGLAGGRAPVRAVPAPVSGPDRHPHWVCRRYRRGGAVAHVLQDRHLRTGETRPTAELLASQAARERGVRTPAIVAGAVYPAGLFYRADLVTELVPNAPSLADLLFGDAREPDADRDGLLGATGRAVRSLEEARVLHPDLNAGNVVVPSDEGEPRPWVIDLDRCRVLPLDERRGVGDGMRRRLERSLAKLGERHHQPLTALEWEALQAGYEERA